MGWGPLRGTRVLVRGWGCRGGQVAQGLGSVHADGLMGAGIQLALPPQQHHTTGREGRGRAAYTEAKLNHASPRVVPSGRLARCWTGRRSPGTRKRPRYTAASTALQERPPTTLIPIMIGYAVHAYQTIEQPSLGQQCGPVPRAGGQQPNGAGSHGRHLHRGVVQVPHQTRHAACAHTHTHTQTYAHMGVVRQP